MSRAMNVLVINSGSSSIKFSLYASADPASQDNPRCVFDGEVEGIGNPTATLSLHSADPSIPSRPSAAAPAATQTEAFTAILNLATAPGMPPIHALGYRVVHPGPHLTAHQLVTPAVLAELDAARAFAPLHDPAELAILRQGIDRLPHIPHFVCFDTVFHNTMPPAAITFPIPENFRAQGVRRYGFHGLSCESILHQLSTHQVPRRLAIAHLGSGCSVTAVLEGKSVDTTMGLTPTGGIVMGTRPGDLDPGLVLYLLRQQTGDLKQSAAALEHMLNHDAGLVALTGLPNDTKLILAAAAKADPRAQLALDIFTRSVTKALGSFCWLLGGLDAIVFTGGIGEHAAALRTQILAGLEPLGVTLDPTRNATPPPSSLISTDDSALSVLVLPAQEDLMIARHVLRLSIQAQ